MTAAAALVAGVDHTSGTCGAVVSVTQSPHTSSACDSKDEQCLHNMHNTNGEGHALSLALEAYHANKEAAEEKAEMTEKQGDRAEMSKHVRWKRRPCLLRGHNRHILQDVETSHACLKTASNAVGGVHCAAAGAVSSWKGARIGPCGGVNTKANNVICGISNAAWYSNAHITPCCVRNGTTHVESARWRARGWMELYMCRVQ